MSQTMGQTIKKLRKERNLTQEELAEQLNISPQAVSRWENETSMPDISQVVPLANAFGVSTEVLFGTFGLNNEEEVEQIIKEAFKPLKTAYTCPAIRESRESQYKALLEGLKTYPNNVNLLTSALRSGICLIDRYDSGKEEEKTLVKEIYNECVRISDVIFNCCKDISIILDTHGWLTHLYLKTGEFEKAKEQANALPNGTWALRGVKLARIQQAAGEVKEEIETRCDSIYNLISGLEIEIAWLGDAYRKNDQIKDAYESYQIFYDIIHRIYKDSDCYLPFLIDNGYHEKLALCAMKLEKHTEALAWLEKMYNDKTAIAENWNKGVRSSPPIFNLHECSMAMESYKFKQDFLDFLSRPAFDAIRNAERFQVVFNKVSALSD